MPFDDFTLEIYREPEFRLSRGAHFTREADVCVLEAVLACAGYPHQRVTEAKEMPRAFSVVPYHQSNRVSHFEHCCRGCPNA